MGTDELATYLGTVERDQRYRVERVLKESAFEVTERVWLPCADGTEAGPFIRKRIREDAEMGHAYERLFDAYRAGDRPPHLPRVFDCFRRDGELVAVMEHVEGETLQHLVESEGPSKEVADRVFPALCDAVAALHERFDPPIIHRDIKPGNVVVSPTGPVLIDFGIARTYDADAERDTTRFGTRAYAPPEQFGFGQTDVRSDVYALGMLLRFCVTGTTQAPGRQEEPKMSATLRQVVSTATAFDPDRRYRSVRELRTAYLQARPEAPARHDDAAAAPPVRPDAPKARCGLKHTSSDGSRKARALDVLGRAWNVVVLLAAGVLVAAGIAAVFSQDGPDAALPLWYRVFEYLVFFDGSVLVVGYLLLDRRRLKRRFAFMDARPYWQQLLGGLAVVFALVVALTVLHAVAV